MGVKIGDKHSDDFGLFMTNFEIEAPTPQTYLIDVPGRNGSIDLTEALGAVKYKNRSIKMDFIHKDATPHEWHEIYSELLSLYHGKRAEIIFDADADYYYSGRLTVSSSKEDQIHSSATITADCDPYAYEVQDRGEPWKWDPFNFETGVIYSSNYIDISVNGTQRFDFDFNGQMPVVPTFELISGSCKVTYRGTSYTLNTGMNRFPELIVDDTGVKYAILTGTNAALTIHYRGGKL